MKRDIPDQILRTREDINRFARHFETRVAEGMDRQSLEAAMILADWNRAVDALTVLRAHRPVQ